MSLKAMTLADMEQHYIVLLYIQMIKPTARATVDCFVFHLAPFFSYDRRSAASGCVCQKQLPAEALNEVLSASL